VTGRGGAHLRQKLFQGAFARARPTVLKHTFPAALSEVSFAAAARAYAFSWRQTCCFQLA